MMRWRNKKKTSKVEHIGSYDDMRQTFRRDDVDIILLPDTDRIGIVNAAVALQNLSVLIDRAKEAFDKGHYIEFISLKLQYVEFFLKIYWVIKNPAGRHVDPQKQVFFGTLVNDCDKLGFDQQLLADVREFNEQRVKAIHKFLTGETTEDEIEDIARRHAKLGNDIRDYVLSECGQVVADPADIPSAVNTMLFTRSKQASMQ